MAVFAFTSLDQGRISNSHSAQAALLLNFLPFVLGDLLLNVFKLFLGTLGGLLGLAFVLPPLLLIVVV